MMIKAKCYVKQNWGLPFIFGFMVLLISVAVSLSMALSNWAIVAVEYAYYALAIGVLLQLVCFLKYGKKASGAETI